MAAEMEYFYDFDTIQTIQKDKDENELPDNSRKLLKKIYDLVTSPNYSKTPVFKKNYNNNGGHGNHRRQYKSHNNQQNYTGRFSKMSDKNSDRNYRRSRDNGSHNKQRFRANKRKNPKPMSEDEWNSYDNFKTTKIIQNKTEFDGEMYNIKMEMNKITSDNYDSIYDNITLKLDMIIDEMSNDNMNTLCKHILDIASSNSFYSNVYAKLFHDLSQKYDALNSLFDKKVNDFVKSLDNLDFSITKQENPDAHGEGGNTDQVEYDLLCKYNNDVQKIHSLTKFITLLIQYKGCELAKTLLNVMRSLLMKFECNKDVDGKEKDSDQFIEIMCIMMENGYTYFKDCQNYDEFVEDFTEISEYKPKKLASFTSKSLFRVMDILDMLEDE